MTKKQLKLLRFLYANPCSVSDIYEHFSLDYTSFVALAHDLTDYIDFDQRKPYESSTLKLTHHGESAVESFRRNRNKTIFHVVVEMLTLAIAIAAFIQGFYVLPHS